MTARAVYVDTETSGLISDDGKIPELFCAVVTTENGEKTYYRGDPVMDQADVDRLATQLCEANRVYTFNGTSFDLRVIAAHASPDLAQHLAALAVSDTHIDVLYDFASRAGYYAALSSFSTDHTAPKSMSGGEAALKWLNPAERDSVLKYCANDVDMLRGIVRCVRHYGRYERTAKSGRSTTIVVDNFEMRDPLVAYEAHTELDLKWMTDPPDLSEGFAWALAAVYDDA